MSSQPFHVLLAPVGSAGDVHPFLGLGHVLRARGHAVTVIVNGHFERAVRAAGFEFAALGSDEQFVKALADPALWQPGPGSARLVFRMSADAAPQQLDLIREHHKPGRTVLVAGSLAFGARVAHELLDIPLATMHLSPSIFLSTEAPPRIPGLPLQDWLPRFVMGSLFRLAERLITRPWLAAFNAWRATLGLPPVKHLIRDWWHSPQLVLAMFPAWFAPPQADWPRNVQCVGFPLYDERHEVAMPDEVKAFLDSGDAPIAFTPGSANLHGRDFFQACVRLCTALQRRGLLLTRHGEQIPGNLPANVRHVPFAPFSLLLPRCAALVSHGGIGTISQGLAAGIPQLVTPLAHDQFDNAHRLEQLGVAVTPKRYLAGRGEPAMQRLLSDPAVKAACAAARAHMDTNQGLESAADAVERLAGATLTPLPVDRE